MTTHEIALGFGILLLILGASLRSLPAMLIAAGAILIVAAGLAR